MSAYASRPRATAGLFTKSLSENAGWPMGRTTLSIWTYSAAVSPGVAVSAKKVTCPKFPELERYFSRRLQPATSLGSPVGLNRFCDSSMIRTEPLPPCLRMPFSRFPVLALPRTQKLMSDIRALTAAAPAPVHQALSALPGASYAALFQGCGGRPTKMDRAISG